MGTLDTKLLIADALVQLCEEQPLKKVSISDIVERTGKNRKNVLLPLRRQECSHYLEVPIRSRTRASKPIPREHPGLQEGRRPLSFELPVLHHAEIGRALA